MRFCFVIYCISTYLLLPLWSCIKSRGCFLLIDSSTDNHGSIDNNRVNIAMANIEDALVSPSGQGSRVLGFCNITLNLVLTLALFSPMERSSVCFVLIARLISRKWQPGWAPPVRLATNVNFFLS